nr:hypothetical protein [Tanacetum cinerariifolium]
TTLTDIRLRPSISLTPADLEMDEDMGLNEQAQSSDDEDIGSAHIPKASALASNNSPPPEDSLLTQTDDIATFMDWFYKRQGITELKPQDLEGPAFEMVKVFLTIQSDFFFSKDLEYLKYGSKGRRPALSISKMKAEYYPEAGLEQMVPVQFWIDEECKYDIAAIVVRIEVFYMYGYDYMKKIVLHHADLNEHVIVERDFKYLYPSDFEDMYLLNLQGHLNRLPPKDKKILTTVVNQWTRHLVIRKRMEDFQLGIEIYQTQLDLTKPQWDARSFEYKHDYTVIDSPKAVMFRDKYGVQMMMRFNEIHKFSDGTLVKEFRINRMNPGLNTRFWTRNDVDQSKAFMFAIQKRLKTRRIFCNLESFVGGRWVFNSMVHSFRALFTLRRSGLRTPSTAAKPYQGDSLEFYLITGSIYTDQRGTLALATLFNGSEQRHFRSVITNINLQESRRLQLLANEMLIYNSMLTLQNHYR